MIADRQTDEDVYTSYGRIEHTFLCFNYICIFFMRLIKSMSRIVMIKAKRSTMVFFLECSAFQPLYRVNIARNRKRTKLASRQNLNETKIKLHEGNRQSAFDPPF